LKKCEIYYSWAIETSRNAGDWADSGVLITASVVKDYAFGSQTVMEKRGDGAVRWSSGTIPMDKTFTGQRTDCAPVLQFLALCSCLELIGLPRSISLRRPARKCFIIGNVLLLSMLRIM
jgi:hypothetical protein